jgi:hypothetical protein
MSKMPSGGFCRFVFGSFFKRWRGEAGQVNPLTISVQVLINIAIYNNNA